jgi:uncharacterized NAD(P)/FAD-binding protein YdhS
MADKRNLGIIGVGPRGGYALECLVAQLIKKNSLKNLHFTLFEASGNFGGGHVYDTAQSSSNWINITERILELDERKEIRFKEFNIPSFPSYHDWIDHNISREVDAYPPRRKIGKYLNQRFCSLIEPLVEKGCATMRIDKVHELQLMENKKINICTSNNTYGDFDEILLTIGHQPTKISGQMAKWQNHVDNHNGISLFQNAYPLSNILSSQHLDSKSIIGIRGFGLTMIDVARRIAKEFGDFQIENKKTREFTYAPIQKIENLLVPFSLDGLPPVPKPLNKEIDDWFAPSATQLDNFEILIGNGDTQKTAEDIGFLLDAFAPIAADIFLELPKNINPNQLEQPRIEDIIKKWLKDPTLDDPAIVPQDEPVGAMMESFVGMATGQHAISLDFCIGQVWRHCQPSIYKQLSYSACPDNVFAKIIMLDESTKRYSYGPPVEAIQQLIALKKAGVLNLDYVNNPEIELVDDGWRLANPNKSITVNIMVDSVLDQPKIKEVTSSLVRNMLSDGMIQAVHDELGVATDDHGYILDTSENTLPIALLGRLAKGTVIGVDAILECFGPRITQWAEQAASNHNGWLQSRKPAANG